MGPLEGVRVVDLTMNVLGPMATQVLGDAGADVIKVEAPDGDPMRRIGPCRSEGMAAYFYQLNRNKRSVVLDLKQPGSQAAMFRLVAAADVFVHNIRTAAAERLGLGYAALSALNPRLIYASAGGFRKGSSLAGRPAFDDVMQGQCGLASLNAGADGHPRYVPTVIADKFTGHTMASAVAMALYHRERTGCGQELHVPMLEAMLAFLLPEHMWGESIHEPSQGLGYPRMLTPDRRPYPTSDGHVCVLAVTDEQWRRLLTAVGRPELVDDTRFATIAARSEHVDALFGVLTQAMSARTTAEWMARFEAADLPHGPVNSLQDLLDDAYLAETGFFQPAEHPSEGATTLLSPPVAFSLSPASIRLLPPRLGEHTRSVLLEVGMSEADISALAV